MPFFVEYAAHVDHGIQHTSDDARIGLGILGAVVAVAIVVGTGGAGIFVVAGAAGLGGGLGMDAGGFLDNFLPKERTGAIKTGFETVVLGKKRKQAARAHTDTTVDCHKGDSVKEGSIVTMLGREWKPMARRQDRTTCSGQIMEGEQTILVGGDPSEKGKEWDEEDSRAVKNLDLTFSLLKAVGSAGQKEILKTATELAGATTSYLGDGSTGDLIKSVGDIGKIQGNFPEMLDQVLSLGKGGAGAVDLATRP